MYSLGGAIAGHARFDDEPSGTIRVLPDDRIEVYETVPRMANIPVRTIVEADILGRYL